MFDWSFRFYAIIPKSLWWSWFDHFISLSAVFDNGLKGSVSPKWQETSLSHLLNSPWIIFLALSHITAEGTPTCWKRKDNSSSAWLFRFFGNKHDQSKSVANICAKLWPLLDSVFTNNVSLYTECGNLLTTMDNYLFWSAVITTGATLCRHHAMWCDESYKCLKPHFFARTKWSSAGLRNIHLWRSQ